MIPERRPVQAYRRPRSRVRRPVAERRPLGFERMEPRRLLAGVDDDLITPIRFEPFADEPATELSVECSALTSDLPPELREGTRILACSD